MADCYCASLKAASPAVQVESRNNDKLEVSSSGEYRRLDNPLYGHAHHVYESIL